MNRTEVHIEDLRDLMRKVSEVVQLFPLIGKRRQAAHLKAVFLHMPRENCVSVAKLEWFRNRFLIPYKNKYARTPPYNFVCLVNGIIEGRPDVSR